MLLILCVLGWVLFVGAAYHGWTLRRVSKDIYVRQARSIRYWQDRSQPPSTDPLPGLGRKPTKENHAD